MMSKEQILRIYNLSIGVHICNKCCEVMIRCVNPINGWVRFVCNTCKLIIPVG